MRELLLWMFRVGASCAISMIPRCDNAAACIPFPDAVEIIYCLCEFAAGGDKLRARVARSKLSVFVYDYAFRYAPLGINKLFTYSKGVPRILLQRWRSRGLSIRFIGETTRRRADERGANSFIFHFFVLRAPLYLRSASYFNIPINVSRSDASGGGGCACVPFR